MGDAVSLSCKRMAKSQTIIFEDDTIELMKNNVISSRPYLVRLTGWNNYYDFRSSKDDLRNLAKAILLFTEEQDDQNQCN